jgi:hypothetical protein
MSYAAQYPLQQQTGTQCHTLRSIRCNNILGLNVIRRAVSAATTNWVSMSYAAQYPLQQQTGSQCHTPRSIRCNNKLGLNVIRCAVSAATTNYSINTPYHIKLDPLFAHAESD